MLFTWTRPAGEQNQAGVGRDRGWLGNPFGTTLQAMEDSRVSGITHAAAAARFQLRPIR